MEEGNSKMEIKILQTEEVPKAVQLARGVFEYCLRNTINEAQLIESFYTYVREENIRQLMETQKLTIWAAYDEQNNMVAVSGIVRDILHCFMLCRITSAVDMERNCFLP